MSVEGFHIILKSAQTLIKSLAKSFCYPVLNSRFKSVTITDSTYYSQLGFLNFDL